MWRPGLVPCWAGATFFALALPVQAQQDRPLAVTFSPDLTPDIQAMPRLGASTPAIERINARLAQEDAEVLDWNANCNTEPPNSYVERAVDVVFLGPGLVSLLADNGTYCPGAAHGNHFAAPLTFDLTTGEEINWPDHFPATLLDPGDRRMGPDYGVGSVMLTDLYLSYATTLPPECRDSIRQENGGYFRVWPSAVDRGLILMPCDLPRAIQACAGPIAVPASVLGSAGFSKDLVAILERPAPISVPAKPATP